MTDTPGDPGPIEDDGAADQAGADPVDPAVGALSDITADDVELVDRLFGITGESPASARGGLPDLAGYGSCEEALEDAVSSLEAVTAERDEYLHVAQRVQADFENYKRRVDAQRIEHIRRAAEGLVEELLPVLDGCEAALAHGAEDVAPIHASLFGTLEKQGLTKIDQVDVEFDPNLHEAVLREEADEPEGAPTVAEVMRAGYEWNGRVVRPAMVKVRG